MKIEILNKSNKKRIIIGVLLCTLILLVLIIVISRTKNKLTESINTGNKISSNGMAIKIENEETGEYDNSDVVPTSGYTLNTDSSYCKVNGEIDETVTLEYRDGKVYAKITNTVTNCYVYFDKITDATGPTLTVTTPASTSSSSPTYTTSSSYTVSGTAIDEESGILSVTVNGTKATVNADGTWSASLTLTLDTVTTVEVIAMNGSGVKTTDVRYVKYIDAQSVDDIIASKTISTRTDFSTTLKTDTTGTLYTAQDDFGTSYYYAGAPTDNYVSFAGFDWRIIRINGNGSIRMITSSIGSVYFEETASGRQSYVQYIQGSSDSTIKAKIDTWYVSKLTNYESYLDTDAGFCGDKTYTVSASNSATYHYGAYTRLSTNKSPSLKCSNSSSLYTVSSSSKGNKDLDYPIGLISADEVAYAGGVVDTNNTGYYLKGTYWTMTPWRFEGGSYPYVACVSSGSIENYIAYSSKYAARPVINLKPDTLFLGLGTSESPYTVVGAE